MTRLLGEMVEPSLAQPYVREWLPNTQLAMNLNEQLPRLRNYWALIDSPRSRMDDPTIADLNLSAGVSMSASDRLISGWLKRLASCGARTLLVDDDFRRRGDSDLVSENVVYADDRVLYWAALSEEPDVLVNLLRNGASGYPLIAIVSPIDAVEFSRRQGQGLDEETQDWLAASSDALVVSIFDNESYLVALSDQIALKLEDSTA